MMQCGCRIQYSGYIPADFFSGFLSASNGPSGAEIRRVSGDGLCVAALFYRWVDDCSTPGKSDLCC
jgi:hypothetical protein